MRFPCIHKTFKPRGLGRGHPRCVFTPDSDVSAFFRALERGRSRQTHRYFFDTPRHIGDHWFPTEACIKTFTVLLLPHSSARAGCSLMEAEYAVPELRRRYPTCRSLSHLPALLAAVPGDGEGTHASVRSASEDGSASAPAHAGRPRRYVPLHLMQATPSMIRTA